MQNAYFPYLSDAGSISSCNDAAVRAKRILDIVVSVIAILLLWPLALMIAIAIRVTSPGPAIFRQKRIGYQGREFTILKFRSMVDNNDDTTHREFMRDLITSSRIHIHGTKLKCDPRVTFIGRLLRRTCLDEIPQFVNVLKGDMSLVGPRPSIPYEYQYYDRWQRRRLEAMPGITGLWQVSKRETVDFNGMVTLDLMYIQQRSLFLDLKILAFTPLAISAGRGTM